MIINLTNVMHSLYLYFEFLFVLSVAMQWTLTIALYPYRILETSLVSNIS